MDQFDSTAKRLSRPRLKRRRGSSFAIGASNPALFLTLDDGDDDGGSGGSAAAELIAALPRVMGRNQRERISRFALRIVLKDWAKDAVPAITSATEAGRLPEFWKDFIRYEATQTGVVMSELQRREVLMDAATCGMARKMRKNNKVSDASWPADKQAVPCGIWKEADFVSPSWELPETELISLLGKGWKLVRSQAGGSDGHERRKSMI